MKDMESNKRRTDYEAELMDARQQLYSAKRQKEKLERAMTSNSEYVKYIEAMGLMVKSSSGEKIAVNESSLVGFSDMKGIQVMRLWSLKVDIERRTEEVQELEQALHELDKTKREGEER